MSEQIDTTRKNCPALAMWENWCQSMSRFRYLLVHLNPRQQQAAAPMAAFRGPYSLQAPRVARLELELPLGARRPQHRLGGGQARGLAWLLFARRLLERAGAVLLWRLAVFQIIAGSVKLGLVLGAAGLRGGGARRVDVHLAQLLESRGIHTQRRASMALGWGWRRGALHCGRLASVALRGERLRGLRIRRGSLWRCLLGGRPRRSRWGGSRAASAPLQ
mmetsp:Transcript_3801/g.9487  ORF Transcript_3801/g.9487 Transcript_3801/m.9487 type:complete len:219 (+) Transcript_3801:29-685(+)